MSTRGAKASKSMMTHITTLPDRAAFSFRHLYWGAAAILVMQTIPPRPKTPQAERGGWPLGT